MMSLHNGNKAGKRLNISLTISKNVFMWNLSTSFNSKIRKYSLQCYLLIHTQCSKILCVVYPIKIYKHNRKNNFNYNLIHIQSQNNLIVKI
jgi:hypothetical protein